MVSFTQRRQKATSGVELVRVRDSEGMLPRMQDVLANLFDAYPVFHLREHERTAAAHLLRIPAHYVEVCADGELPKEPVISVCSGSRPQPVPNILIKRSHDASKERFLFAESASAP